jgi:murein L,D-transpeptidase YafK
MLKKILFICVAVFFIAIYFDKLHPRLFQEKIKEIDKIVVKKEQRMLSLFNNGNHIKSYSISLGRNPKAHKTKEGDGKTPEGIYFIDWKHPNSSYHKAIRISYPNAMDKIQAIKAGKEPGGDIMVHGMPNCFGWLSPLLIRTDWTEGCIAVSNTAIEEIASSIKIGTKIVIEP